jgi:uncharacterized protein (TIGR02147 family)
MQIYDYRDYKTYLAARSAEKGMRSGFKSALARASGCNSAYISSVLGGKAHFSLEQAERVCGYLEFSREERHYFLLLVQKARSSTASLATYFEEQIERVLKQKLNVQNRLGAKERLTKENQALYYSSWIYAAIHVALSVPRLARSPDALAAYFDLPLRVVNKALEFLLSAGLAKREGQGYAIGPRHIHLGKKSENIQRHHGNWRLQILRALERDSEENLNYSSVVTLSRADAFRVREILLASIKNSVDLIIASPEEEVFALAVDFVKVGK